MVLNRAAKVVKLSEVKTVFQPCFQSLHMIVTGSMRSFFFTRPAAGILLSFRCVTPLYVLFFTQQKRKAKRR